jgi:hypothetical protein
VRSQYVLAKAVSKYLLQMEGLGTFQESRKPEAGTTEKMESRERGQYQFLLPSSLPWPPSPSPAGRMRQQAGAPQLLGAVRALEKKKKIPYLAIPNIQRTTKAALWWHSQAR